jgi:hypothetical protein
VDDADPRRVVALADALSFMPSVRLAGEDARRAAHGTAVALPDDAATKARPGAGTTIRLLDGDGLIALAEVDPDGQWLKPVVGLRG